MSNDNQDAHVPSRRDALKAVGGVAVGAASFWAAAAAAASDNIAGASESPHVTSVPTTIAISVNGVALTNVTDVTSVARSVAVVQSSGSAGARNSPGTRAASSISFSVNGTGTRRSNHGSRSQPPARRIVAPSRSAFLEKEDRFSRFSN